MRYLLIALALAFSVSVQSQNDKAYVDELVNEFSSKLKERGIASFFETRRYCDGSIKIFEVANGRMCASRDTYYQAYMVWKEPEGQAMIKKIDNCGLFYSLPLADNELIAFYESNRKYLVSKPVRSYKQETSSVAPSASTAIHPCGRFFRFYEGEKSDVQTYKLFDLTNESDSRNLNYEYNSQLEIVTLDKKLDEVLVNMEPKFRRIE